MNLQYSTFKNNKERRKNERARSHQTQKEGRVLSNSGPASSLLVYTTNADAPTTTKLTVFRNSSVWAFKQKRHLTSRGLNLPEEGKGQ